ncbi:MULTISPECIES: hypothetical protein [Bacteria]|uniref:Uncharacterized protein n=1 Tax=Deinococcus navajonensis TaxID=309884 RepID=A0ABV8XSY5_9DEIO
MNVAQALVSLFPTLDAARDIHEQRPSPVPSGAFFVVSELTDGSTGTEFYRQANGRTGQVRELTLLVTLYGQEGWKLSDLSSRFRTMRAQLPDLVDEHPGYPPLRGVRRGPVLPPTPDSLTKRPLAGVRLICTYIE